MFKSTQYLKIFERDVVGIRPGELNNFIQKLRAFTHRLWMFYLFSLSESSDS